MPKGGARKGAGRKPGAKNRVTGKRLDLADKLLGEGDTPLEYMLRVMRDPLAEEKRRDAMATAAAPYMHPKLAAVEHSGELNVTHEDAIGELE